MEEKQETSTQLRTDFSDFSKELREVCIKYGVVFEKANVRCANAHIEIN